MRKKRAVAVVLGAYAVGGALGVLGAMYDVSIPWSLFSNVSLAGAFLWRARISGLRRYVVIAIVLIVAGVGSWVLFGQTARGAASFFFTFGGTLVVSGTLALRAYTQPRSRPTVA